jgi:hypothetical protein
MRHPRHAPVNFALAVTGGTGGIGRYDLSRPQEIGLLAYERSPQGLQPECRGHGGIQKNFAERVAEIRAQLAPGTPLEAWFQDEMRVGQKNKLTCRWARKGSRPRAAHDQRTQSTDLFGAVCPERGAGAALVLPACWQFMRQNWLSNRISNPSTISSTTLGTHSSISPGRSCPSRDATGQQSVTQTEEWFCCCVLYMRLLRQVVCRRHRN